MKTIGCLLLLCVFSTAVFGQDREISHLSGDLYHFRNQAHVALFLVTDEGVIATDPISETAATWLQDEIGKRFDREVQRLLAYPCRALIVESTWTRIEQGEWRSQLKPSHVIGSLLGWVAMGLPVVMAGDHDRAGRFAARLLFTAARRRWRELRQLSKYVSDGPARSNGVTSTR